MGALVLAGGAGRRFGSDKRIAQLGSGKTVLTATLEILNPVFAQTIVVLKPGDEELAESLKAAFDRLVCTFALDASLGMGHSLAHGAAFVGQWYGAAVCLGDMPFIQPASLQRLIDAFLTHEHPSPILVPNYNNRPGHPVIFHHKYFEALSQLKGDQGARRVIDQHRSAVQPLLLADPGIHQDIDRPEDLASTI